MGEGRVNIDRFVRAVASVLPERRPISHHDASIGDKEIEYVTNALKGTLYDLRCVQGLEQALASYCGVENAIATTSGTAALHLALIGAGVEAGDEVLLPTLTYAATANAVRYTQAVPHFIDGAVGLNAFKFRQYIATKTEPHPRGRLNPKTGRVITAIISVDLLGFPADNEKLIELAHGYKLKVIIDAAESLGSCSGNKRCGSFGDVSIFSFNDNKIVTGNGGGALLTDDPWIAAKAAQLANTGRVPHPWRVAHDVTGFNYRLHTINAALALAQFERLPEILDAKRKLHRKYAEALSVCDEFEVMENNIPNTSPNYWLTTVLLKPLYINERDKVLTLLHEAGIHARALFTPLHTLPMFADCPRSDLSYADYTFKRAVCLPSGAGLCGS